MQTHVVDGFSWKPIRNELIECCLKGGPSDLGMKILQKI